MGGGPWGRHLGFPLVFLLSYLVLCNKYKFCQEYFGINSSVIQALSLAMADTESFHSLVVTQWKICQVSILKAKKVDFAKRTTESKQAVYLRCHGKSRYTDPCLNNLTYM